MNPAVFFKAQRFVFGGAGTICSTEKKLKNIAALAPVCGFRATVRCSRKGRGLARPGGHWDKTV